ncbi:MAG: pyrroline-5-carboxylate reductase family protein [Spiroplasma sp.]
MNMKIGFLGAGHMGRAIIAGLLGSKKFSKEDFKIVVSSNSSIETYQAENFFVSKDWNSLLECEVVILALRPNVIRALQNKLTSTFNKQQIIISVAAGLSLASLAKIFPSALITRAMPNTSCANNQSTTMISKEGNQKANKMALTIFNWLGKTVFLSEDKIHVFIAICGSASAYLYYWMQPLMHLALANNISLEDSKSIIVGLLSGVAVNIEHSSESLETLQKQVSVPGGTTVEAIKVFDQHDLKQIISSAIQAVARRSQELE